MSVLIGLTGRAQHGKDTAAAALVEKGYTRLAFADRLKALALLIDPMVSFSGSDRFSHLVERFGWEEAKKNPEVRRFLQQLGTRAREVLGPNVWVDPIARELEGLLRRGKNVVISDVRFPNEAEMIHAHDGKLVRVVRPGFDNGVDPFHPSESQVDDLGHDVTLVNDSTVEDLAREAYHYTIGVRAATMVTP